MPYPPATYHAIHHRRVAGLVTDVATLAVGPHVAPGLVMNGPHAEAVALHLNACATRADQLAHLDIQRGASLGVHTEVVLWQEWRATYLEGLDGARANRQEWLDRRWLAHVERRSNPMPEQTEPQPERRMAA